MRKCNDGLPLGVGIGIHCGVLLVVRSKAVAQDPLHHEHGLCETLNVAVSDLESLREAFQPAVCRGHRDASGPLVTDMFGEGALILETWRGHRVRRRGIL
mgnify:CR=1 FL=1